MRWILCSSIVVVFTMAASLAPANSRIAAAADGEGSSVTARATLKDVSGATVGDASLLETPHGVLLQVDLHRVPPGTRAFHIHEVGRCDPPDFDSAGDHFAPAGNQHGFLNERGPHAGDLPNLRVPRGGRLSVELFAKGVTLGEGRQSLLDGDGAALVIHADEDDYRTDPSGEAGDRIACGVITR